MPDENLRKGEPPQSLIPMADVSARVNKPRDETGEEIKLQGLSIHVADISRGQAAAGMNVEIYGPGEVQIFAGTVAADGLINDPRLVERLPPGPYVAIFHTCEYFRKISSASESGILDVVRYDFGISDPGRHYHLPMKLTEFGLSCFLGGYGSADVT